MPSAPLLQAPPFSPVAAAVEHKSMRTLQAVWEVLGVLAVAVLVVSASKQARLMELALRACQTRAVAVAAAVVGLIPAVLLAAMVAAE